MRAEATSRFEDRHCSEYLWHVGDHWGWRDDGRGTWASWTDDDLASTAKGSGPTGR